MRVSKFYLERMLELKRSNFCSENTLMVMIQNEKVFATADSVCQAGTVADFCFIAEGNICRSTALRHPDSCSSMLQIPLLWACFYDK